MTYVRRPFLMGNTAYPISVQPALRGAVAKDSAGCFPSLPIPSELAIETELTLLVGGPISAVFTVDTSMAEVLTAINTALAGYAVAQEYEGCLVIQTVGTGEGAYVRISPPISGFDDASAVFGFEVHPHPSATVRAGDTLDAPTRPRQQVNPPGTKFLAIGEDRVGAAYNRGLHALATNSDLLYSQLRRSVARSVRIVVDETTHGAYVVVGADGAIEQVDLSDLSVYDASLAGKRLYVGGLSRSSTLREISESYGVLDAELKEIPAGDAAARIGAVTRGELVTVRPSFADEVSAPTSALPDTSAIAPDGKNALGVDRVKHAATVITEIRERTTIVCSGATFVTNGVAAGDKAVISLAGVTSPFCNNGEYLVETVVTEEELVLRPVDGTDTARELNPTVGDLGQVEISSGGDWERGLWVSFIPAIPRFPTDGKIVLTLPVETPLGDVALGDLVNGSVRVSNNVADWSLQHLWKRLSLGGAYQGMAEDRGGGFLARVTHRPVRFDRHGSGTLSDGTTSRSSTGSATLDANTLRLTAAAADRFDLDDVGCTILLTAGTTVLAKEPWTIIALIDSSTVELAPPVHRAGFRLPVSTEVEVTAWEIVAGDVIDVLGSVHVISPEFYGDDAGAAQAPAVGGYVFSREQLDETTAEAPTPGLFSFLHLERIRLLADGTNVTVVTAGPVVADDALPLPFAPEESSNFLGESAETKTLTAQSSITFVRILAGPNAGLYRVKGLKDGGTSYDGVTLQHLDGAPVTLTAEASLKVCFYCAKVGTSVPLVGGPAAAAMMSASLSLFADGYEPDKAGEVALRVGWRGVGGGLLAYVNDPEFIAYGYGDAATGNLIQAALYAPALGVALDVVGADAGDSDIRANYGLVVRAHTSLHDYALGAPGADGSLFHSHPSFAGYFAQTGDDPGLLVIKQETSSAASTAYSRLSPSASLLVGRSRGTPGTANKVGPTGRGSAAELAGSLWVYRKVLPGSSAPNWAEGGIFCEDSVGAGKFLYPMVGAYDFSTSPFYGADGVYLGWGGAAQLGKPGRVYPALTASTIQGLLNVPDYASFNFTHSGTLTALTVGSGLLQPFSSYVGCRVILDDGALSGSEFAIVGVVATDANTNAVFALYKEGVTVGGGDVGSPHFRILGQRWWHAFVDVGDFMTLGTTSELDPNDFYKLPVLTVGRDGAIEAVGRGNPGHSDDLNVSGEGLLTPPSLLPSKGADGVGLRHTLSEMADFKNLVIADPNAPSGEVISHPGAGPQPWIVRTEWEHDNFAPRNPMASAGVVVGPIVGEDSDGDARYPTLSVSNPGSLLSQDYVLEHVVQETTNGAVAHFSARGGGALRLTTHPDNDAAEDYGTDSVRLWKRGFRGFNQAVYGVKVQVILHGSIPTPVPGHLDFTVALRLEDGTAVVSQTTTITSSSKPSELSVTWTAHDLLDAAADLIQTRTLYDEAVHVTVDVDVKYGLLPYSWDIFEIRVESLQLPARVVGPIQVTGEVRAHDFRFPSPATGFDARGPADVDFLNPHPYGRFEGSDVGLFGSFSGNRAYELQEGYGAGAVSTVHDGPRYHPNISLAEVFKKGPHSAAIRLAQPFFDPLWYAYLSTVWGESGVDPDFVTFPCRTGFIIPFNPPHGARLASLEVGVSTLPSLWDAREGPLPTTGYGVFHSMPSSLVNPLETDYSDWCAASVWRTVAGVSVRFWRNHVMDFGVDHFHEVSQETRPKWAKFGWSELLMEQNLSFPDGSLPTSRSNEHTEYALKYLGEEVFVKGSYDLAMLISGEEGSLRNGHHEHLMVDRRHFSYYMTVEFWGGPRLTATDADTYSGFPDSDQYSSSEDLDGSGYEVPVHEGGFDILTASTVTPVVLKFRGARLGWVTDRVGSGW